MNRDTRFSVFKNRLSTSQNGFQHETAVRHGHLHEVSHVHVLNVQLFLMQQFQVACMNIVSPLQPIQTLNTCRLLFLLISLITLPTPHSSLTHPSCLADLKKKLEGPTDRFSPLGKMSKNGRGGAGEGIGELVYYRYAGKYMG